MRKGNPTAGRKIIPDPAKKKAVSALACIILTALIAVLPGCTAGQGVGPDQEEGNGIPEDATGISAEAREGRPDLADADTFSSTGFVMDTVLRQTIYGMKDRSAEINEKLSELETGELSWREQDSEVAKVNAHCGQGEAVRLSDDFYSWVQVSLELAEKSGGAFDPTIGELTRLWNIEGEDPSVPLQADIDETLSHVGYEHINIEETDQTITMDVGCTLDLGAVGKGIACDVTREYLESREDVLGAVIAVGGSILTYGSKPDGEDWKVAVQDPAGEDGTYMGALRISGTACVSTSGDYEKYFVQDGKKYHHILDPATGYPSESGLSSVTVICPDTGQWREYAGLLSDGLSTACFVLGEEKGAQLLSEYGMEGVFIDQEGNVTITDGVADRFELLNTEEYRIS